MTARDKDYVLGTHDEEMARLALQHRVWRPRVLDAWRRADFTVGQTLLDVGCGPGHAALDMAEIVGATGRVIAFDRSRRFLDALESTQRQRGFHQIETRELDLDDASLVEGPLADAQADGAWCRWVLAFVKRPRQVLRAMGSALRRGGVLVLHEYFDYSAWRMAPRNSQIEEFVRVVIESWRASGGEPDIGLQLPHWLVELGFTIRSVAPIIDVVSPANFGWQWPKSFVQVGLRRLIDLGHLEADRAEMISNAFAACEADPHALMVTPGVLEIIAVRS